MNKRECIQVDFYPDGRVVKIYKDDIVEVTKTDTRHMTPQEALQKRFEEYKKRKKAGK